MNRCWGVATVAAAALAVGGCGGSAHSLTAGSSRPTTKSATHQASASQSPAVRAVVGPTIAPAPVTSKGNTADVPMMLEEPHGHAFLLHVKGATGVTACFDRGAGFAQTTKPKACSSEQLLKTLPPAFHNMPHVLQRFPHSVWLIQIPPTVNPNSYFASVKVSTASGTESFVMAFVGGQQRGLRQRPQHRRAELKARRQLGGVSGMRPASRTYG